LNTWPWTIPVDLSTIRLSELFYR